MMALINDKFSAAIGINSLSKIMINNNPNPTLSHNAPK